MLSRLKKDEHIGIGDRWYIMDNDNLLGEVSIDLERSRDSTFELRIEKGSRGPDEETAAGLAERISYNYSLTDSSLILDPYFRTDKDDKWRIQRLSLTIYVPEGKAVSLNKNTAGFLDHIYNLDHYSNYRMAGKTWIMHQDGLENVR